MPTELMQCCTVVTSASMLTPKAANTSALPDLELTARLPCLATLAPQAANTKATAVEILKVPKPSPPVPQVSIKGERWGVIGVMRLRIAKAAPPISSLLSPLQRKATKKAAIWTGEQWPSMI